MPSPALAEWRTSACSRLDDLESLASDCPAAGPSEQLTRCLFLLLVAQFQRYCRDLLDEATAVHVAQADARQVRMLRALLAEGRKLDRRNPRSETLGSDFGRLPAGRWPAWPPAA